METTAGIDLASEEHRLVVVEPDGRRLDERRYSHSEEGITALVRRLLELAVGRVAIERPNGLVVDRLLAAGIAVVAVHPNQLAASRDRYRAGGGKSDGFDAYVLAELARTDMHRFRLLEPDNDETRALRALTRAREDLVEQRVALANQLRAQLEAFWPGATRIFADLDSPICLAFLERYPSPDDARSLGAKRLAGFLARNGYSGRRKPTELLARLREAPTGKAAELETEARRAVVLALVAALKPLVEQIKLLTSQIAGALEAHTDGHIFRSLFRDPRPSSPPLNCSPRSATAENATPPAARSKRSPAKPRSPSSRAKRKSPASAGPATNSCAAPSAFSPTQAANTTPGPTTSTSAPARAATTTRTRSASSAAPGSASSGASGTTTTPTTPANTAASTASSHPRVDTGRLMPGAYEIYMPASVMYVSARCGRRGSFRCCSYCRCAGS